jgi:arylsulfatase
MATDQLDRRSFLKASLAASVLSATSAASAAEPAQASPARRPNVLFIMTDQQREDVMSGHGGAARTPNLDKLAAESFDCRTYFSQAPVCVPARCSLFTGRYGHAHRVLENNARLAPHEAHLFKVLKQAGYHLGYVEKNHLLDREEMNNFDVLDLKEERPAEGKRKEYVAFAKERMKRLAEVGSWASDTFHDFPPEVTDAYLSRQTAVKFIQEAPADRPFCLCVSFTDPHVPHLALRKFESQYPLDQVRVPESPAGVLEQKAPRFLIKREVQGSLKATEEDKRRYLAVYYSMISWVDQNIGTILAALDGRGLRDNTIIVFTSDHGDFNFQYGMCKKDLVLLDCLLHVPFMISWKGQIQPRRFDRSLVEQVDVMPTLLELCGLAIPFGCQGKSLGALLKGENDQHKDTVYAEICPPYYRNDYKTPEEFLAEWKRAQTTPGHPLRFTASYNVPGDHCRSMRTREWKYIWYASGFEELYDLKNDPGETVNLALKPANRARCSAMRLQLFEWAVRTQDPRDPAMEKKQAKDFTAWKIGSA